MQSFVTPSQTSTTSSEYVHHDILRQTIQWNSPSECRAILLNSNPAVSVYPNTSMYELIWLKIAYFKASSWERVFSKVFKKKLKNWEVKYKKEHDIICFSFCFCCQWILCCFYIFCISFAFKCISRLGPEQNFLLGLNVGCVLICFFLAHSVFYFLFFMNETKKKEQKQLHQSLFGLKEILFARNHWRHVTYNFLLFYLKHFVGLWIHFTLKVCFLGEGISHFIL